jgi:hypothetical protein
MDLLRPTEDAVDLDQQLVAAADRTLVADDPPFDCLRRYVLDRQRAERRQQVGRDRRRRPFRRPYADLGTYWGHVPDLAHLPVKEKAPLTGLF